MYDLVVIGAGPAGISAAFEAKKAGLEYIVIEKGLIGNTIYNYPVGLTVFSTTNELEFVEGDLKPARDKPTREELLSYYVRFVLDNELTVRTEETVLSVDAPGGNERCDTGDESVPPAVAGGSSWPRNAAPSRSRVQPAATAAGTDLRPLATLPNGRVSARKVFRVVTDKAIYEARNVLFAIGAMDFPRKLGVPGEELSKVHDHFRETYPWVRKKALVVGGGNSAGEAALFLAQEGADATLAIFRSDWENNDPKQGCIKYWVKQPLEEELNEHCLNLFFLGKVIEIRETEIELESETGERVSLPNDVVFVLIGSDADLTMMKNLGVETEHAKYGEIPVYDSETFETNVPGVFVAGHFTNQRHIKGAIDAGPIVVSAIASRLAAKSQTV